MTRQFRINKKAQVYILRQQFPLRPAAAKTIHRCQGYTLGEAVVDFPVSAREHMHYVGLSRVRNSSVLHILNLIENKIKVSEKVKNEMSRLRTEATLVPLTVSQTVGSPKTKKILFQNVRSLHLHIYDVRSDYNIQKLLSTFLLKQSFACQIEMTHISFVNLCFTGTTSINLQKELAMELLFTLRMI